MTKLKCSRLTECLAKPQGLVLLLLPCLLLLTLYLLSSGEPNYDRRVQYIAFRGYNDSAEVVDGYLVWNPKCHMLSKEPLDPSILKFVKKEKFEACNTSAVLSSVRREANGSVYLIIDPDIAKHHSNLTCCWSPINRPAHANRIVIDKEFDSKFDIGKCEMFDESVQLPASVDTLLVSCKTPKPPKPARGKMRKLAKSGGAPPSGGLNYENVHAILNPERVRDRLNSTDYGSRQANLSIGAARGKLSVLMLGLDSVSRLNFHRSMPLTRDYLEDRGWLELRGYNKMGDNTFPNLMAFLTGQSQSQAYDVCKPKSLYGLDNCSFIWRAFREAGYVTAYGEDVVTISTFNYLKVGFVEPPTDYYLRPYMLAAEKQLKSRRRFNAKYCTGPMLNFDRIMDYAMDFAKTFLGLPYFGFFWTNGVSHENVNGPSSIDDHLRSKLLDLEAAGVMNDSMVILLSDHGMRFGDIRSTFVGWYEERLPFIYISLPDWFREQEPEAYAALRLNRNRLTSPFDLYETLRDLLQRAGGNAPASSGCPECQTLFRPVPKSRGCADVGIAAHWCTCDAFQFASTTDRIVVEGAHRFVDHMDEKVLRYRNKKGQRLCARPRLKKIHRVDQVLDLAKNSSGGVLELFYLLEVMPGDGKFETTIRYHGPGNFSINDEEVSRINSYGQSAKCLAEGYKQYCHCTK